jgi:glycine/D-amino acid oxidase-like deaminating enzyme
VPHYGPLTEGQSCEVAVIGGGVTGALVADALVADGIDVVLLESDEIGGGSTSASTALLLYEIDVDLYRLEQQIGQRNAVRAYELCREAIYRIEELCAQLHQECGDGCGFAWKPSWYLASRDEDEIQLRCEYAARRRYGFDVELLSRAQIEERTSFSRAAALVSTEAAQIDVYRFTHRLLQRAQRRGLHIYAKTPIVRHVSEQSGVILNAANGNSVRARRVVFATGYEAQEILKRPIVTLHTTYVVAGEPVAQFEGWPNRCLMWETARPYLYLRTTEDGRPMIGGEDDSFCDAALRDQRLPQKAALLTRRFRALFPHIPFEQSYSYAGVFGITTDGLAYIGAVPEFDNSFFALGFGGNGITYSVVAADILVDLYRGRRNADAALFSFNR